MTQEVHSSASAHYVLVCMNDGASATPGIRTDGPNFTGEETQPHRGPGWPFCPITHVGSPCKWVGIGKVGKKQGRHPGWGGGLSGGTARGGRDRRALGGQRGHGEIGHIAGVRGAGVEGRRRAGDRGVTEGHREGRGPGLRQDHLLPGAPAAHPSQSQPACPRS